MVDHLAFATLDIQHYSWHVKLYCLCARRIPLARSEFIPANQNARPMIFPEVEAWGEDDLHPKRRRGGGRGKGGATTPSTTWRRGTWSSCPFCGRPPRDAPKPCSQPVRARVPS